MWLFCTENLFRVKGVIILTNRPTIVDTFGKASRFSAPHNAEGFAEIHTVTITENDFNVE
jgi:hypothetical protein